MRAKERWRESQRNRQLWEENEALNLPRQRSEAAGASKRALERAGCRIRRIWALTLYHLSARAPLECSLPIALPWIICAASSSSLPLITNSVLNCNLNQLHLKSFRQNWWPALDRFLAYPDSAHYESSSILHHPYVMTYMCDSSVGMTRRHAGVKSRNDESQGPALSVSRNHILSLIY